MVRPCGQEPGTGPVYTVLFMLPPGSQLPVAIMFVAAGVLSCFLGQRLFRAVLTMYGFVLGALLGSSFLGDASTWTLIAVVVGAGLAGALILSLAYFMGVALVGAGLAVALLHAIYGALGGEVNPWFVVGVSVAGALAALLVQHYVIVTGTAFAGAWVLLVGVLTLMRQIPVNAASNEGWITYPLNPIPGQRWVILAWVLLSIFGIAVQLGLMGRAKSLRSARARRR